MPTIELYVKNTSNVPGGLSLTSFETLSETWIGESIVLPFGPDGEEHHKVTGWTDIVHSNPYPDVVRGCPTTVYVVKVRQGDTPGYLVYGGNSGLRIAGRKGWGQPIIWVEDAADLPTTVQTIVEPAEKEKNRA